MGGGVSGQPRSALVFGDNILVGPELPVTLLRTDQSEMDATVFGRESMALSDTVWCILEMIDLQKVFRRGQYAADPSAR